MAQMNGGIIARVQHLEGITFDYYTRVLMFCRIFNLFSLMYSMKFLLKSTAVIEFLTGLGLVCAPAFMVDLLMGQSLTESAAIVISMIAGGLISIALICWLVSDTGKAIPVIKGLALYNFSVVSIVLFSAFQFSICNPLFVGVAGFHFIYGTWCLFAIRRGGSLY